MKGEHIAALVPWPTWVAYFLVFFGSAALVLRCLIRVYGHFLSAASGREQVDMPPEPASAESAENAEGEI